MLEVDTIAVGYELPAVSKGPVSRQRLVEWCAAENDYFALHYDERVAAQMNLPGTPIQGTYRFALMGQMVEAWMGPRGRLRRITTSYRGLALEGERVTARGRVTSVEKTSDGTLIHMEVWVETDGALKVAQGEAVVHVGAH